MKESPIHRAIAKNSDGSGIAIRKNRFRAVSIGDGLKFLGGDIQCLIPGDAFEGLSFTAFGQSAFGDIWTPQHRVKQSIWGIYAVKIFRHLSAKESLRYGMTGVSLYLHRTALFIHRNQNTAGIRAIVRTDRMNDGEGRSH